MPLLRNTRHTRKGIHETGGTRKERSVTLASATVVDRAQIRRPAKLANWQNELWDYFDTIGELRYSVRWLANAVSRCVLYIARPADAETDPDPDTTTASEPARRVLDALHYGHTGQPEMLRRMAIHLSVPGETNLVGMEPDPEQGITEPRWYVASSDELKTSKGKTTLTLPDTGTTVELDPNRSTVIRMWIPHARHGHEPDSPVRATIPVLREIKGLSDHISATVDSRLAGAGMVAIPESATTPTPGSTDSGRTAPLHTDPFTDALMQAMLTPIADRDDASAVVPIIVRVPDEAVGKIQHISFATELSENVSAMRKDAVERFAGGADLPGEVITGTAAANHWCTLDTVEIMTRDGWRTYDQLTPGQEVLTLNHDTGLSEWQPLIAVNTWQVTDEPMVEITGRRHRSVTTANHRWPVLSGKPGKRGPAWTTSGQWASDATEGGNLDAQRQEYMLLAAPHADVPSEPKYSDALVEIVAWTYTEGRLEGRPGRNGLKATIYQSRRVNPDHCASIERALTNLFGPESETLDKGGRYASEASVKRWERARRLKTDNPGMSQAEIARKVGVSNVMVGKYLKNEPKKADGTPRWRIRRQGDMNQYVLNSAAADVIAEHCPNRVVTPEFIQNLTLAQLELFIDVSIRADGHYSNDTTPVFYQKDPERNDAFELACILSGRSTVRADHTSEGISATGPKDKTIEVVRAARTTTFSPRGRAFKTSTHTGTVWCPTTPNGTWLARHEGTVFYTGNSAWQLEEASVKLHVEPLVAVICDALTQHYLWPALRAMNVDDPEQWTIWYNASELVQRPNRSAEAQALYDRGALSLEAVLRENGFDTDDAPTPDERNRWLATQIALSNPGMIPALQPLLNPGTTATDTGETNSGPLGLPDQPTTASAAPDPARQWWLCTVEQVVLRALELAGKRMTARAHRDWKSEVRRVNSWDVHTVITPRPNTGQLDYLLDKAYDTAKANFADDPCVLDTIDAYCRHLLSTGKNHTRDDLAEWLADNGCEPAPALDAA